MNRSNKAFKRLPLSERKAIADHLERVGSLNCVVTGYSNPTLHHCHSGSMSANGINRGGSQRPSDWLVIPITANLHIGNEGIDGSKGVVSWEKEHGTQIEHLKTISRVLGYNVFKKAGYAIEVEGV